MPVAVDVRDAGGGSGACEVTVDDLPVVRLTPCDGRVRAGLVLGPIGRAVDVSLQPGAVELRLVDEADRARTERQRLFAATDRALERCTGRAGGWRPARPLGVTGRVGGAALPLLGAAYDRGADVLVDVPRWAAPVLAAPTPRAAAAAAYGRSGTRPVAAALVRALAPDGASGRTTPALHALALAAMGTGTVAPDRLAAVLDAAAWCEPPARVPDVDAVAAGAVVVRALGPDRGAALLLDAATEPGGVELLRRIGRLWPGVAADMPHRPPARVAALWDACRALVRTDHHPAAGPHHPAGQDAPELPAAPAAHRAPRAAPARQPHLRRVECAGAPRPADAPAGPAELPPVLDRNGRRAAALALHGAPAGPYELAVPRSDADLLRWSRLLANCLDTYGDALRSGACDLVGVLERGQLVACVEIDARGALVQFATHANRAAPGPMRAAVLDVLEARGVVARSR